MNRIHETQAIVLRKVPYSESSLIISCLTPDYGRLDLMVKGARRIQKKKYPEFDIFNELQVFFVESLSGNIHNINSSELVNSGINIANNPQNFKKALSIVKFILNNTHFNMRTSRLYLALRKMIADMSINIVFNEWELFIKLTYLSEEGFLPKFDNDEKFAKFADFLTKLNAYCEDKNVEKPQLTENYIEKLIKWVDNICISHSIFA
ncbi:MAG TPA: DNA repair protein RecO [Victivallales bacterium]|nr:DNA repair protein RecO [Victivallales bacterium]HRU00096.1 DNA repair protein RecO [Victivallales bacterium]